MTICIIPYTFYIGVALNLLFLQCNELSNILQEAKNFLRKTKRIRDGLSYSAPKKVKKQGEMALPSLGPIPLKKCRILGWVTPWAQGRLGTLGTMGTQNTMGTQGIMGILGTQGPPGHAGHPRTPWARWAPWTCWSTMTDSESHTPTVSLLERLKAPKHSDLTQKCAVDLSPPPKGKKGLDILKIIGCIWENKR